MERGTTLADPVDVDQKPNLRGSNYQISEYLKDQGAYDLFSYLLKDLLMRQPDDPLEHMLKCLQTDYPFGPLRVIITSPPCIGRSRHARRLAEHFGLEYIGAAELLGEAGLKLEGAGFADEAETSKLVLERVDQAIEGMQGFVLDGFPRTRVQTSFLKDRSVVPTHVIVLTASAEDVLQHHRAMSRQDTPDEVRMADEDIEEKLRWHSCHSSSALEVFRDKITYVPLQLGKSGEEAMWNTMEASVRMLPRSNGPQPPVRVVVMGPRGIGAREHASRLAARLGAVFVDGADFPLDISTGLPSPKMSQDSRPSSRANMRLDMSVDLVQAVKILQSRDPLGALGKRLRDPDCTKQGWVVCGFPMKESLLTSLRDDTRLAPTRIVLLEASVEICVKRLKNVLTDAVTGKVWTALPKSETMRKRLARNPEDHPQAVREAHAGYCRSADLVFSLLNTARQCAKINADGPPEMVHNAIVEFVERPLPLPPRE